TVHPRIASEDHIGYVADGPCLGHTLENFLPRQPSAAYEAGDPAASLGPARPDPMQFGAQLLRAAVLALLDLECGERVDLRLTGLLPGLGRSHLAHHLHWGRAEVRLTGDVGDQLAYIPRGAVGRPRPVIGSEGVDGAGDSPVFGLGHPLGGRPSDGRLDDAGTQPGRSGDDHEVLLAARVRRRGPGLRS